jgi:sec-independent protein translocase protein TatA
MFELLEPTHLLFIFVVALLVFGPTRLVEIRRNLGRTIQSIQDYREELKNELRSTSTESEDELPLGVSPPNEKKGWVHMFTGLESPTHLLLLLVIILLLFGAKRLPEMGRSLGQGIREFKAGMNPKEAPEEEQLPKAVEGEERK